MKLTEKSKLNNPKSTAHLWQLLLESWAELSSIYLQFLVERMPKICEAVIAAKGVHFDELKFKTFLWVFFF